MGKKQRLSEELHSAILIELTYGMSFEQLNPELQVALKKVDNLESRLSEVEKFLEDLRHRPYVPPWLINGLEAALKKGARQSCGAVLYHGPGHQSKAYCERKDEHTLHFARYGNHKIGWWGGNEAITGFFDEPPDGQDEFEKEAALRGEDVAR